MCSQRSIVINLIIMTLFWTTSSFCDYLLTFYLKYIPGNIFINTSLSVFASLTGHASSGVVSKVFGIKIAFFVAFILASAGGLMLIFLYNASGLVIGVFVLFAKFGCSFAFNLVYFATPQMFPAAHCGMAFGICNIIARFSTIFSPLIAELPDPVPMTFFSAMCIGSAFMPIFLRKVKKSD